jgi:hypothetical protein
MILDRDQLIEEDETFHETHLRMGASQPRAVCMQVQVEIEILSRYYQRLLSWLLCLRRFRAWRRREGDDCILCFMKYLRRMCLITRWKSWSLHCAPCFS